MKGNSKIIDCLNVLLASELTATNQYMVHAEMCENWKYGKLYSIIRKRAIDEMKHAEKLIARILFLEGIPLVSNQNKIAIGAQVSIQHENDRQLEEVAIKAYNDGISLANEIGDHGTRDLLTSILKDEENHIDTLEAQIEQIAQMGLQNYLAEQVS